MTKQHTPNPTKLDRGALNRELAALEADTFEIADYADDAEMVLAGCTSSSSTSTCSGTTSTTSCSA